MFLFTGHVFGGHRRPTIFLGHFAKLSEGVFLIEFIAEMSSRISIESFVMVDHED